MLKPSLNELIKSSFKSIFKNKARTALTSLGIIIGVSSVILLSSIGNGLKSYITQQFDELGANTIFVSPGKIFSSSSGGGFNRDEASRMTSLSFTQKDIRDLDRGLRNLVTDIAALSQVATSVKYKNQEKEATLIATSTNYQNISQFKYTSGNWFNSLAEEKKDKVAVLGSKVADELFANLNPLNKSISFEGKTFQIIGVLEKQGSSFGGPDINSYVFIPYLTGANIVDNKIQQIVIKARHKDEVSKVKLLVEDILLDNYDKDTFSVFDSSQLLSSINSILSALTLGLSGIAAISLVVGGIGIMNIMLVTVTERTREIGLRKAIGAYPRAILLQFLFEAIILSSIGGVISILIGFFGSLIINNFFPSTVTIASVLLAFSVSFAVGIVFGVAPARKASKLDPIVALRYE